MKIGRDIKKKKKNLLFAKNVKAKEGTKSTFRKMQKNI